jgi:hypothetical protein
MELNIRYNYFYKYYLYMLSSYQSVKEEEGGKGRGGEGRGGREEGREEGRKCKNFFFKMRLYHFKTQVLFPGSLHHV